MKPAVIRKSRKLVKKQEVPERVGKAVCNRKTSTKSVLLQKASQ